MPCYTVVCQATLWCAKPHCGVPTHTVVCQATLWCAMPQVLPWGFTLFSAKLCHAVPKCAASYCAVRLCTAQALLLLFELCPYCSLLPPGLVLRYDTLGCVVLKHAEHCYAEFGLDPALYEGQARPTVP